ncbi:MAG: hypothetical protein LBL23_04675 [Coriobacteriales bacterium]|jgi:hypothetical protein|nr:hypothetical protein [Coriobacteriales bacterium]
MAMPEIILSMTSYPQRIETTATALEPLLHQTVQPSRVLLWLPAGEFEEQGVSLPVRLAELEAQVPFFEIRWTQESLKPHNKYFWTMLEYPDDLVITVDDDLVHATTLVQTLLDLHYRLPTALITNRSHLVTLDADGAIAPYRSWEMEQGRYILCPRNDVIATHGAGALFPPHTLPREAFDADAIRATSLLADDLWLMAWEYMNDVPVVSTGLGGLYYIEGTQDISLYKRNLDQNENDLYLARLYELFPSFHEKLLSRVGARLEQEAAEAEEARRRRREAEEAGRVSYARRLVRKLRSL